MKEYITLKLDNDMIVFNYETISNEVIKLVDKNSFFEDTLFYTLKYFKKNINNICKQFTNIKTMYVKRLVTFKYVKDMMNVLKIENLKLDFRSTISLNDYELFLELDSLKQIDCYYMPKFIKNKFESKGVTVNSYNRNKISDRFMLQVDAFDYETLYYIKNLCIKEDYPNLLSDIKEFLRINYNLKAIHIYIFSKEKIEGIVDLVKNDEARNVMVFLHQAYDYDNFISNNFEWLRNLNEKCKSDYTCEFKIIYSNSFLRKNLFKQLTFNNLKLITVFGVYVSLVSIIIVKSYQFVEKASIDEVRNNIINNSYAASDTEDTTIIEDADIAEPAVSNDKTTKKEVKSKYTFKNAINELLKTNNETVGFLKVNNTNINYPVVQHSDNSYYLNHDFYKKKKVMGWVFLDYRNSHDSFDSNNVIYGHNMPNKTMFGSLSKVMTSSWRKNKNNLIISYDTVEKSNKFKIFSIYKIDYTTDYLKTKFSSKEEFDSFVKMIRNRSTLKSNEKVEYGDKILTLSTCADKGKKRLVVHAVLMD